MADARTIPKGRPIVPGTLHARFRVVHGTDEAFESDQQPRVPTRLTIRRPEKWQEQATLTVAHGHLRIGKLQSAIAVAAEEDDGFIAVYSAPGMPGPMKFETVPLDGPEDRAVDRDLVGVDRVAEEVIGVVEELGLADTAKAAEQNEVDTGRKVGCEAARVHVSCRSGPPEAQKQSWPRGESLSLTGSFRRSYTNFRDGAARQTAVKREAGAIPALCPQL